MLVCEHCLFELCPPPVPWCTTLFFSPSSFLSLLFLAGHAPWPLSSLMPLQPLPLPPTRSPCSCHLPPFSRSPVLMPIQTPLLCYYPPPHPRAHPTPPPLSAVIATPAFTKTMLTSCVNLMWQCSLQRDSSPYIDTQPMQSRCLPRQSTMSRGWALPVCPKHAGLHHPRCCYSTTQVACCGVRAAMDFFSTFVLGTKA